jgi:hypothetical protein
VTIPPYELNLTTFDRRISSGHGQVWMAFDQFAFNSARIGSDYPRY